MADLPSVDDVLGAPSGQLPSVDDVLGPAPAPSWTSTADKSIQSFTQHVLNGFSAGARQAFGEEPISTPETVLSPETVKSLKDAGIFNDYKTGQNSFIRSLAEGTTRAVAAGAELLGRTSAAAAGALLGGAAAAGEETGLAAPGTLTGEEGLVGAATDPGLLMLAGPLGEAEAANAQRLRNLKTTVSKARAAGAIGEGDAEFYGAAKPTPEALQQRVEAAKEVGSAPSPELPVPKTPHELARRIEPEAFQQYDELAVKKDQLRQTIEKTLTENPDKQDIPEVSKAYNDLLEADAKQQELLPTLRAAYDKVGGILPEDQLALAFANKSAREEDELNIARDKAKIVKEVVDQLPGVTKYGPLKTGKLPANAFENKENIAEPGPLVAEHEQELKAIGVPEVAPVPGRYAGLRPVEGTGETRVRGLAAGVEEKALENKLTEGFGDIPEYKMLNMADQAQKAIAFVGQDFEAAKDVAMGRKQPPPGLAVASVFKAVEDAATNKGDAKLISDLGQRSKVLAQITTMAQNIRVLAERDPISPVGAIQELARARTEAYGAGLDTAHAETIKDIKDTMGKASSPVSKWEQFIQSIACKE